jgi:hypothetical protein
MAFVPIAWPDPRASLAQIYAQRGVTSIFPNQGHHNYLAFGQSNKRNLQVDEVGTPAHTANPYIDDNGNGQHNHDARIPDGWELFGPTLGKPNHEQGVAQCIIKIADRDRILYVPPREKVPQQWIAVNVEADDLPDLFNQGWQIYEVPYLVAGGMIYVTLVKSPRAIPPVPPVPVPAVAPAAVNVNVPPNVPAPPQGGTRRRKRNRKVHSKTNTK